MARVRATDPHFKIRLPPDLKARITAAASGNTRTINAEIVHALHQTYCGGAPEEPMPQNREMTEGLNLRLPDGMRDEIKAAAKANGRSMNSEVLARLQPSMSLRDWFAGQAMAGYCSVEATWNDVAPPELARASYRTADAMLAQREK